MLTKSFWRDAAVRAVRTMAQTALASLTVGATVAEVDWLRIASMAVVAGVYSLLMSLNNLTGGTAEEGTAHENG